MSRSFNRLPEWHELPHGMRLNSTWNCMWTWNKPQIDINELSVLQKVNHFCGAKNIVRKDLLARSMKRVSQLNNKTAVLYDFNPLTFILPKDWNTFCMCWYNLKEEGKPNVWIIKPTGLSRGRGISLINDIAQVSLTDSLVAQ